jgi:predicted component of type VI protein secretion system
MGDYEKTPWDQQREWEAERKAQLGIAVPTVVRLEEARKEIADLRDALAAERAARRKLTLLLDDLMGTPCEQIRAAAQTDREEP